MKQVETKDFMFTMDPHNKWPKLGPIEMLDSCGYIPGWLMSYSICKDNVRPTLQTYMGDCYKFGLFEMKGGKVKKNLVYKFPEDPPLYPIMHFTPTNGDAEFVMWQHAICAIRETKKDAWFVTRMD